MSIVVKGRGGGVDMDEFYQEINAIFYLKWVIIQGEKYNLQIEFEDEKQNTVIIKNDYVEGKIIYYGNGIFEEELTNRQTNEKIFYLHFQLTHFNHAIELFKEMVNCAIKANNKPQIRVLLCCSGGLTTTLFASKMSELAMLENLPYQISATGYTRLYEIASEYDVIILAPQVGYLLPQVKHRLDNKIIFTIPTRIFATSDFSGALKLIHVLFESMDNM